MTDTTDQEQNDQDIQEQDQELSEQAHNEYSTEDSTSAEDVAEAEELAEAEDAAQEGAGELADEKEITAVAVEEEVYEDSKDEDPVVEGFELQRVIEGALFAAGEPLSINKIQALFEEDKTPSKEAVNEALEAIQAHCEGRGYALKEVGNGWRFFVQPDTARWVNRLWDEKPQKYSRALLETLALIAYRQPLTRGDIEEVRGVAVSSHIIKTLTEREWVKVVGHRDVPGRPALYATTKTFLDYFNLKSLDELPNLGELKDIDSLNADLAFEESFAQEQKGESSAIPASDAANDVDEENAAAEEGDAPHADATETDETETAEESELPGEEIEAADDAGAQDGDVEDIENSSELESDNTSSDNADSDNADSDNTDSDNTDSDNTDSNDLEEKGEAEENEMREQDEALNDEVVTESAEDTATEKENPNG